MDLRTGGGACLEIVTTNDKGEANSQTRPYKRIRTDDFRLEREKILLSRIAFLCSNLET
jgi:hypothetical protein